MRFGPAVTLLSFVLLLACGGLATRAGAGGTSASAGDSSAGANVGGMSASAGDSSAGANVGGMSASAGDSAGASAGGMSASAGGMCAEPASAVPDTGVFQAPPIGALGAYQVTFHNRCAQTVWPAWASTGGLDSSVIDTQLWLPMSPASDRTVTVYGGVREVEFWGRTGCHFDPAGSGACQTGECGGFVCQQSPLNATIFALNLGFSNGYNLGLRVEGPTCGKHECVADIGACSNAPVLDPCGSSIACSDICSASTLQCCYQPGAGCRSQAIGGPPGTGDLVITFCP